MDNNTLKEIKRLNFENIIWIIFIVISLLDIYGDELLKDSLRNNDKEKDKKAKSIFFFILIISIVIYIYFFIRNYNDYKHHPTTNYQTRVFGSILILTGTICLLYFQISQNNIIESPSNI